MSRDELDTLMLAMPFSRASGVELLSAGPDEVSGRMGWAPDRCTAGGFLHGGALVTLADTLGAICASFHLPEGARTTTIESKSNFFRGVASGAVRGDARPLHAGRSTIVVQTDLRDEEGRRVAQVTQTQIVILSPRAAPLQR